MLAFLLVLWWFTGFVVTSITCAEGEEYSAGSMVVALIGGWFLFPFIVIWYLIAILPKLLEKYFSRAYKVFSAVGRKLITHS